KVLIAKSLCEEAHLYVWDEPLNFIDVYSRMQIERLIMEFAPTMLLVEHDNAFRETVASKIVTI
ncbi:MAG: Lsa family ABC-F type ribosomal protection protein, partial [Clostridia bacterium]|nr:Lsa family ABC-F type ribosomal protection protein [Clostridia bacterium]